MKKNILAQLIEDKFYPTVPIETKVVYKDGQNFIGFFHNFDDYKNLMLQSKYRFIPKENIFAFKEELDQSGFSNQKHSIILDCDLIESIEQLTFRYKDLF
ncbi:MAG: hypothetical protein ABIP51_06385 [Bacteroidia bacterium]